MPDPVSLGQTTLQRGFVTRFNAVGANEPGRLDSLLGYKAGTLSSGYYLCVLTEPLRPNHVLFAAYSYASGGRWGLPKDNPGDDQLRPSVHTEMVAGGNLDVERLRKQFAEDPRNLSGSERIIKIIPFAQPPGDNPADDYPPGLGIAQWILTERHKFLAALEVDATGIARTAEGWSVAIGPDASYDSRARIVRYISTLKA